MLRDRTFTTACNVPLRYYVVERWQRSVLHLLRRLRCNHYTVAPTALHTVLCSCRRRCSSLSAKETTYDEEGAKMEGARRTIYKDPTCSSSRAHRTVRARLSWSSSKARDVVLTAFCTRDGSWTDKSLQDRSPWPSPVLRYQLVVQGTTVTLCHNEPVTSNLRAHGVLVCLIFPLRNDTQMHAGAPFSID